jgi:3'-phosphoadenosine 5'-phosphosulfate sulfotransferase (PAPS reductase)/FAD synthetase
MEVSVVTNLLTNAQPKKHIVSFSGGRTSAYMVHLMEQKRINDGWDVEYVFCDTGAEHPKTYDFIRNVVSHYGINLHCIKSVVNHEKGVGNTFKNVSIDGIGFDLSNIKQNMYKYGQFSIMNPFCTDRLKTIPLDKYCKATFGSGFKNWLGMRIDEPRRLKNLESTKDMFGKVNRVNKNIMYLAQISDFTKQDVLDFWLEMPFDLEIGEHLGNCVFCVKKGAKKLALAARQEPELAKLWDECFKDESIRLLPANKYPKGVIYRNMQSLGSIIQMFDDFSEDDLKTNIKKTKSDNSECSESCEAQIDMFTGDFA